MSLRLQHPTLLVEPGGDAAVVRLPDRVLCERTVRGVRRHLPWLVGEPGVRGLHLDLDAVEAPTAGGLGGLVALHERLRATGEQLVLFNVGPRTHEVFRVTGLTGVLEVRPKR